MRNPVVKYALYVLSFFVGVVILIGAQYGYFIEHEIGLVSYIAASLSGILWLPFVFIIIAKYLNTQREQVLKVAVGLWILSILLPLLGI